MKEYKSYLSGGFKIWSLIVFPVFALILGNLVGLANIMVSEVVMMLLISGEVFVDNFGFGGMFTGRGAGTNLMQSSFYGKRFIQRLLLEDIGVRVVKTVVVVGLSSLVQTVLYGFDVNIVFACFTILLFAQIGVNISRHILSIQALVLMILVLDAVAMAWYGAVAYFGPDYLIIAIVVTAVLAIAACVFTFYHGLNCYRKGFEDKK